MELNHKIDGRIIEMEEKLRKVSENVGVDPAAAVNRAFRGEPGVRSNVREVVQGFKAHLDLAKAATLQKTERYVRGRD